MYSMSDNLAICVSARISMSLNKWANSCDKY
jgi:hypothetical protein